MRKRNRLGVAIGALMLAGSAICGADIEYPVLGQQPNPPVAVGKAIGEAKALDVTGKLVPVVDSKAPWTVVAFLSTRCPCTARYLTRLQEAVRPFAANGVRLVGVNANANESREDAIRYAHEQKLSFPLLKDGDDNQAARAFGAKVTPEVFVLGAGRVVRYHGAIDDSLYGDAIKHFYLRDALNALVAGKPLPAAEGKTFGCGIFVRKNVPARP